MRKLKAGTLAYTITIALVVFLLLIFFISFFFLNNILFEGINQNQKIELCLESNINLLLADPEFLEKNKFNYLSDNEIEFHHEVKDWGVYKILIATAGNSKIKQEQLVLFGIKNPIINKALYLCNFKNGISLSGKSKIVGDCYLPELGIRRGSIEGQPYTGQDLVYGTINTSEENMPAINSTLLNSMYLDFKNEAKQRSNTFNSIPDTLTNTFKVDPIRLFSKDPITLNNSLSGNIVIVSEKSIVIEEAAHIQDVIIYAPYIRVEPGFKGTLQLYARDSIRIGKGVKLNYPSIVSLQTQADFDSWVIIESEADVRGDVYMWHRGSAKKCKLTISKDAYVSGSVYCAGKVSHSGNVFGYLQCKSFELISSTSKYENHLLNAVIDASKLPEAYVSSFIYPATSKFRKIKCLD
ncbi:MAG: hypothetical protein K9H62_14000 [Bacteroidales bacterium]|nr:hypothetical protein [Bacteroidales bacterium]